MKGLMTCFLIIAMSMPLAAVENGEVMYAGGTVSGIASGSVGSLDTTSERSLTFAYGSNKLAIPYADIQSFQYSTEVAHHLGVLPAIAVGLLKARERRHYFRISYADANNISQTAVFEVSKQMPHTLQAILQSRVKQSCKPYSPCADRN